VNELSEALESSQQNVSKHLAVLTEVGILGRRKDGTHVYYRIVDESIFALCEQVCGAVQQQVETLNKLLSGVRSDRLATPAGVSGASPAIRRRSGRSAAWRLHGDHLRRWRSHGWSSRAHLVLSRRASRRCSRARMAGQRLPVVQARALIQANFAGLSSSR